MAQPKLVMALLAAGGSKRLGQPKALIPVTRTGGNSQSLLHIKGAELIEVKAALGVDIHIEPFCILGCEAERLAEEMSSLPIDCVVNTQWQQGMASSVAMAASIAQSRQAALMIVLLDQWQLKAKDYQAIIARWLTTKANLMAVTDAENKALSPPIISDTTMLQAFTQLTGEQGGRAVLQKNRNQLETFVLPSAFIDLDTPADLEVLQAHITDENP